MFITKILSFIKIQVTFQLIIKRPTKSTRVKLDTTLPCMAFLRKVSRVLTY